MSSGKHIRSRYLARAMALLIFCMSLAAFKVTLHPGFFPGESARQVAVALRMVPDTRTVETTVVSRKDAPSVLDLRRQVRTQELQGPATEVRREGRATFRTHGRIWALIAGLVANHIPFGALPMRMNALSAVIGALSVALLFALVRAVFLLFTFHVSPLNTRRRKAGAALAGMAAAVALGASAPFWLASTRCLPFNFDVFLLVLMGWLLLKAVVRHASRMIWLFGILLGLGIFESPANVWLGLLLIFLAIRACRMGDLGMAGGVVALVGGLFIGLFGYLLLNRLSPVGEVTTFMLPFRELAQTIRSDGRVITGGWMTDPSRVIMLCFVFLPALATFSLAIWSGNNEAHGLSVGLLLLTLLGTATVALTTSAISPWGVARMGDTKPFPCISYLLVAVSVGLVFGKGFLMADGRCFPDTTRRDMQGRRLDSQADNSYAPLGRLLMGYICVLLFATAALNLREVLDWREPLSNRVAAETVRQIESQRWVVSGGGDNDILLRLYAHMAHKPVSILPAYAGAELLRDPRFRRAMQKDPILSGIDPALLAGMTTSTNAVPLAAAAMTLATNATEHFYLTTSADFWTQVGCAAVPAVTGYRGVYDKTGVEWKSVVRAHRVFWDDVEQLPPLGQYAPSWLRGRRAALRQHLHDVGTRLADELAIAGRVDEAKEVLSQAGRIREEPAPSSLEVFY